LVPVTFDTYDFGPKKYMFSTMPPIRYMSHLVHWHVQFGTNVRNYGTFALENFRSGSESFIYGIFAPGSENVVEL